MKRLGADWAPQCRNSLRHDALPAGCTQHVLAEEIERRTRPIDRLYYMYMEVEFLICYDHHYVTQYVVRTYNIII